MDQEDKDGTYTTAEGLAEACEKAAKSVNNIPFRQVIIPSPACVPMGTAMISSSVRRRTHRASLMQPESSLRLSCAPAIGEYPAGMIEEKAGFGKNPNFNPIRKGIVKAARLNTEERAELIRKNPAYGAIVCRCETISEGGDRGCDHPYTRRTLDGWHQTASVRRYGTVSGRLLHPRAMEILSRETGTPDHRDLQNRKGS